MSAQWPEEAVVYTETVVHTAPERYAADAPYQLAILQEASGARFAARIAAGAENGRVQIGDKARFLREDGDVPVYSRISK
jgi:uncharacterized OB-fold protein